jgi:Phosphotransferase enzyme family
VMSPDVQVSIELGRARANRKPVLQILSGSGAAVGFAKIGVNPLTSSLVRAEHESLERLSKAGLREIAIPEVLHYDTWHGLDVLVLSALPAWRPRRPLPAARLAAAMAELARIDGLRSEPLVGGEYLRRLRTRLASADEGPEHAALVQALEVVAARADGTMLTFGCWHGDWAPWNMANTGRGLLVWDWERFTGGVPLGFDALHYWLQSEVGMSRRDPRTAAAACLERAPQLLGSFAIPARDAQLTAVLYLADLATRYLVDRQAQAGARLGAPGTWLIPAIISKLDRL